MEELLNLLLQLNLTLKKQVDSFKEFVFILDQEEHAISIYNFSEVEKSVILKDQHTRIAESLEEKRINLLKKICYMIAFDSRGQKLSLNLFKTVFTSYLQNVVNLLSKEIIQDLTNFQNEFLAISNEFQNTFDQVSKRIYRNQIILKKIIKHVNLSINLFQSEADSGMNYDSLGKTQSIFNQQNHISSIRVTV